MTEPHDTTASAQVTAAARTTVSVVIPALDEAARLPAVLDALATQTHPPLEVIVADAGSSDATRDIARAAGATVVDGGRPAVGRNAGAAAARGELLLFLDADVELGSELVSSAVEEFIARDLVAATVHIAPIEREPRNLFACDVANFYLDAMQYVVPHAPGFFIMIRRAVHQEIGGFDETLMLAEDHDYVGRAAELGTFRVLSCCEVATSMRRIDKEGLVRLAFMYLYCEIFVVTGRPIREVPFDYEFASFAPSERTEARQAIESLRELLGDAADAVAGASTDGLQWLRDLGSPVITPPAFEERLHSLGADEIKRVRRYLGARARLARRRQRHAATRIREASEAIWRALEGGDS